MPRARKSEPVAHFSNKSSKKSARSQSGGINLVKEIKPKNDPQRRVFESFWQNHLLLNGCAGTGKSYISLYLALREVLEYADKTDFRKVIIVRSAVQTRDLGFMKGSLDEKIMHFETPYRDIVSDLCGRDDAYDILKHHGKLEFMCTSFVRGLTLDNAIILVDEAQNNTGHELDSVITRIGDNSKIVLCGDYYQSDLKGHDKSGFNQTVKILEAMKGVETVEFTRADIVRSKFVKDYICAREDATRAA